MTVARVASAEDIRTGTTDPHTFSYAGGTPRGIAIAFVYGGTAITGLSLITSVSYGGVPLEFKAGIPDLTGEPGYSQIWFLGSGVPAGTQTVSIDLANATSIDIHTVVWELSGAADLEVIDFDTLAENQANPTVTLQANGRNKISLCALYWGGASPGGGLATGNTLDHTHDLGAFVSQTCYETAVDSADHTIGWSTLTSDDVALTAIAVSEVIAATPLTGTLFTKPSTFNTGTVTQSYPLTGTLFANSPTFPTGTVTPGPVTLAGTLLTKTPTFTAGVVTATSTLSGTLLTKAPTFPVGAIDTYTNLVVVELDDIGAPANDLDHYLRAHARTNAGTGFVRVRLFQNTTEIAQLEFEPTGTFTTYSYGLAEAEAAAITDYADLQIHIGLKATTTPFTPEIDWVDLLRPASDVLSGTLFTNTPTFPVGAVSNAYALTGVLFQNAPTFPTGQVTSRKTLTSVVFQPAPGFPVGAVTTQTTLTGNLFTSTPFFQQGVVDAVGGGSQILSGVVFVKTATFGVGAVATGSAALTGTLFTDPSVFPTGVVAATNSLTGTLFVNVSTFPTGTVTSVQSLGGVLFTMAPTFPVGTVGVAGTLFGTLFANTPTFFTGIVGQAAPSFWIPDPAGWTADPAGWTANPAGFVRVGRYGPSPWGAELSGQRFETAPTFPVGAVT